MREIVDGVFEVPITYVHAYLVVVDDGVVLVDTGLPGRSRRLREALATAKRAIGDVHTILLTHHHADHTGAVAELRRDSGAQVIAHHVDAPLITGETVVPPRNLTLRIGAMIMGKPEPVTVDHRIRQDGPLPVAGFSAFHTPGHTAGHVSYLLDRAGGVLFAGDAVTGGRRLRPGPKPVTEDRVAEKASVARLAQLDFPVAVFGHGRAVTDGAVEKFRALAQA
jgi:glyoxylase-like metal-dependent hydrolase (beta-lactamase superfamily II)